MNCFDRPGIGKLYEARYGDGRIEFVIESDSAGATSPCFDCWLPAIDGYIMEKHLGIAANL